MTRILIITNGHLCRNPRPLKEAMTLGGLGHEVTVLTVRNHPTSLQADEQLLRTAPFKHVCIDLLDATPAGRFRRIKSQLLTQGARGLFRCTGIENMASLGPAGMLLRHARSIPAELTIVHNEVPHWIGRKLLAEGRRVAADFEDWHSEDLLPEDRSSRPLKRLRQTEAALLHQAVYTTTTSHALAEALHAQYGGKKPFVITNSFPLQPAPERMRPAGSPPAFFWFSQTLGPGRGLELFLAAWARTREPSRLVLLGERCPGYEAKLLSMLTPDFRARVTFRPLVTPVELPAVIAEHDIGLALEQSFIRNRNLTITNKILQYLNAGLAVVASNTAGQREVLAREPAAGIIVETGETTAFARDLDVLLANRAALSTRQAAARRLAEREYCWEHETARLAELVATVLPKPSDSSDSCPACAR